MSNFHEPVSLNWGAPAAPRRRLLPMIGIGAGALAAGGVLTAGFLLWKGQQDQLAEMAALLEEARGVQTQATVSPAIAVVETPLQAADLMPVSPAEPTSTAAAVAALADATGLSDASALADEGQSGGAIVTPVAAEVASPLVVSPEEAVSRFFEMTGLPQDTGPAAPNPGDALLSVTAEAARQAGIAEAAATAELQIANILRASSDGATAQGLAAQTETAAAPEVSAADQIRRLAAAATTPAAPDGDTGDRDAARVAIMNQVVAGVRDLTTITTRGDYTIEAEVLPGGDVYPHIVLTGFADEQAAMEELLITAAQENLISVPPFVIGPDGAIDGETLMLAVIQRSLTQGTPEQRAAAEALSASIQAATQAAAPRPATVTEAATGDTVYVVERGDSLAYIALQFYGDTNQYARIFEANRDRLESPERIQIGQTLRIPDA